MSPVVRKALFILLTGAATVYAVVNLSGPNGWNALLAKRQAIRSYESANTKLENEVTALEQRNRDIRAKKPEVVVPLVRSLTNGVRQGEQDFHIDSAAAPPAQPPVK